MKLDLNDSARIYFNGAEDALFDYVTFSENGISLNVEFLSSDCGKERINVSKNAEGIKISCTQKRFFRALGIAIKNKHKNSFSVSETPRVDELTFLLDCSRNAVINFDSYKNLVVKLALVGYNNLQIYMEDTLELEGEPYFGHLRGRFTAEELKKMDDYAASLGIEVVPFIQTLAHLDNIFMWPEYFNVWDIYNIVLIGEEKTYALIEKIFKTLRSVLRTDKVNIGFDEAHNVCFGQYVSKFGVPKDRTQIVVDHLKKVLSIAEKYGFHASMWSDMFFRFAYDGNYYPPENASEKKFRSIKKLLPENVDLIYWDYYHEDKAFYDMMIKKHHQLSKNVQFACGVWKWLGFVPLNDYGIKRIIPGLRSAIDNKIKKIVVTSWGDNGNECPIFSGIPQFVVAAEYVFKNRFNIKQVKKACKELFFASYDDFISLDLPNRVHSDVSDKKECNPSKYLLYNDPIYGLFDFHTSDEYCEHYKKCVTVLQKAKSHNQAYREIFDLEITLCDYLGVKANFGNTLKALYKSGDKDGLVHFAENTVPLAIQKLDAFILAIRSIWLKENKIFGLDVLELRLGGQKQRLNEIILRIKEYIDGKTPNLPELEHENLSYAYPYEKDIDISKGLYAYMATPSFSLERY